MIAFTLSTPLSIRATSSSANKLSDARRNVRAWSVPIRTRRSYGARMCDKPQPPEGSTITQALEISFRSVWVSLITAGAGPQYEQAIQQFCVSCLAAYKAGYSLTQLRLELAANEKDQEVNGVDTRLNEREKETRLIWIALVYMTLRRFAFESINTPPPVEYDLKGTKLEGFVRGLDGLVDRVVDAAKKGFTLQTFKLQLSLSDPEIPEGVDVRLVNAQKNLRSQWSRFVFATINMLPENMKGFPTAS